MTQNDIIKPLIAFVLFCAVGLVITFFGLRFYYSDARLEKELTRSYSAKKIDVLAGQGKVKDGALLVSGVQPDGFSFINVGLLHIDTRFYEYLTVNFSEKDPNQPLLLAIKLEDNPQPIERPILYTNAMSSRFAIDELVVANAIITDVGLLTDRIINPYRVQSFVFSPKKLNLTEFSYLLMDCFAINKQWENWSINTHKSPYPVLIPPKILVLIYFTVVGLLFLLYLRLTKRPLINAWWATLVAAWFALDAHYLVEKTVITKNTYDTFAHLSDDEKDLVLSPEAAKIAQTIKSVLPDDGKPKKIRIQFGWKEKRLFQKDSERRYLNGKLHYMLQPNVIYTLGVKMPNNIWKKGDFYYVDIRKLSQRLTFDDSREKLFINNKMSVTAERLLNNVDMAVYQVIGVEK